MKKSIQQFKTKKCFEELANKRMEEMKDLKVNQIDFNKLTYKTRKKLLQNVL